MATNRTRRTRRPRPEVPDWAVHYLITGEEPEKGTADRRAFSTWRYFDPDEVGDAAILWQRLRSHLLAGWMERHPGTRPYAWWRYEAPEPRRRIGGTGVADFERYAYVPRYDFGVPVAWVEYDEDDPPRFESERDYLSRLGLLEPGE